MKFTAIFCNPQGAIRHCTGKQRRQQKYFANLKRLFSESDTAKDTPTSLQTMPSLVLDLEISVLHFRIGGEVSRPMRNDKTLPPLSLSLIGREKSSIALS